MNYYLAEVFVREDGYIKSITRAFKAKDTLSVRRMAEESIKASNPNAIISDMNIRETGVRTYNMSKYFETGDDEYFEKAKNI